ncbi:MAG TPA: ABC transporter ATP-binding protein [Acidimicrobiales bacterium]|nr:ABC transporter ATP-binding protein [Acidimicrobiales bacterium]
MSFEVERGEVFALLGPNGAGKTTCIEILEGFLHRDGGDVQVLGVDPGQRGQQQWLRTRIGVVLQELAVESFFTVRQVLERNAGFYPAPRPIDEVIALVGLAEKADAKVKKLSGGQQRRLDIGLGIIGRPELLFLDEPTTGLDPGARRTTWELIRTLSGEGTTVLLSSHYMDEVEALAKRVAVLRRGQVVATGPPASLGGRDRGEVAIRFILPAGIAASDLPVTPTSVDASVVEINTNDEVVVLNEITNWALQRKVTLTGLDVTRKTLEDVYLALTHEEFDDAKGAANG